MKLGMAMVAAPVEGATVLYDFNPGGLSRKVMRDGLSFGIPELEGDADAIYPMFGNRIIEFTERIVGTKAEALAQHSAMARALMAPRGWLRVQLNADTQPVWFRTFRPKPGALGLDNASSDGPEDIWDFPLVLEAEPFAYGVRVTHTVQTVANDPAAAANPCRIVLPTITGDAPAPLRIEANPSNPVEMHGYRWMFALHAGATQRTPVVWQIGGTDGWAAGDDTAGTASSASYSGGSYRTVSFATNTALAVRVSGVAPTNLPTGRYKVLVRTDRTDNASKFSLRFGQRIGVGYVYGETAITARTASTGGNHATWVDLGEHDMPAYGPPKGENPGYPFAPDIALQVGRVSGTGSLRLDAIMLVSIDVADTDSSTVLFTYFPVLGLDDNGASGIWDGDLQAFWGYTELGFPAPIQAALQGVFPAAVPGQVNVLTVLQQVNGARPFYGSDSSDALAATTDITVSWHPRFLWIGDA